MPIKAKLLTMQASTKLITQEATGLQKQAFEQLKAELVDAWAASKSSYVPLTADEVIARNTPA